MLTQQQLLHKVNAAIEAIAFNPQPDALYTPIRYALTLGGKRLRPVLMLMAYQIYRDSVDDIVQQAVAMETYHNFTLLHDDVMDRADMRRGKPCVHKLWGDNAAILSGDAMLIEAYKLFTENVSVAVASNLQPALQSFTAATLGVCEGQQYDIDFETRQDVTVDEYMEMIRLKTSLLLAYSLKIGAQLAGAPTSHTDALYQFGEQVGLAFQLQDDLLDVYGNPEVFGKKIGGDILCNKKTFMLLTALQTADNEQRSELQRWLEATDYEPEAKIAAVRSIYDTIGIRSVCEQKINQIFDNAIAQLDTIDVETDKLLPLREFAHSLMGREL